MNLRYVLNTWKCRKQFLKKITITHINNLDFPLLKYVANVIHTPEAVFKKINS